MLVWNFDSFSRGLAASPDSFNPSVVSASGCLIHPPWGWLELRRFLSSSGLQPGGGAGSGLLTRALTAQPSPASGKPLHLHMKRNWWILANYVLECNDRSFSQKLFLLLYSPPPIQSISISSPFSSHASPLAFQNKWLQKFGVGPDPTTCYQSLEATVRTSAPWVSQFSATSFPVSLVSTSGRR